MKTILSPKRISELRQSGVKTDSENDDYSNDFRNSNVASDRPKSRILITKTAPSIERFKRYSSSSTDDLSERKLRLVIRIFYMIKHFTTVLLDGWFKVDIHTYAYSSSNALR